MTSLPAFMRRRLPEKLSFAGRVAKASLWSIGELVIGHILRLASNLIMTRLLLPEAFGLMAVIVSLHIAFILLTDLGIRPFITRDENGENPYHLKVLWCIQIVRSGFVAVCVVLAAGLLWWLAPLFAADNTVYADPALPALIVVSSLVILFTGLESTNMHLAMRRLQPARPAVVAVTAQAIGLIAMVCLALIHASVWSLLCGMIIGSVARTLLSHLVPIGPQMAIAWDRAIARDVWHFGKWIMGSSAFYFLATNADRFILAGFFDKTVYGFYIIAVLWIQAVTVVVHKFVGDIAFSAISEVNRERPQDLARVIRKLMLPVDAMGLVGLIGFHLLGGALIAFLYTENYQPTAAFFPLLSLLIPIQRFGVLKQLLVAKGDTKSTALESGLAAIALCVFLPLGFRYLGVNGALLAIVLCPLLGFSVVLLRVRPYLKGEMKPHIAWFVGLVFLAVFIFSVQEGLW